MSCSHPAPLCCVLQLTLLPLSIVGAPSHLSLSVVAPRTFLVFLHPPYYLFLLLPPSPAPSSCGLFNILSIFYFY